MAIMKRGVTPMQLDAAKKNAAVTINNVIPGDNSQEESLARLHLLKESKNLITDPALVEAMDVEIKKLEVAILQSDEKTN
jgi:hypothetical protein